MWAKSRKSDAGRCLVYSLRNPVHTLRPWVHVCIHFPHRGSTSASWTRVVSMTTSLSYADVKLGPTSNYGKWLNQCHTWDKSFFATAQFHGMTASSKRDIRGGLPTKFHNRMITAADSKRRQHMERNNSTKELAIWYGRIAAKAVLQIYSCSYRGPTMLKGLTIILPMLANSTSLQRTSRPRWLIGPLMALLATDTHTTTLKECNERNGSRVTKPTTRWGSGTCQNVAAPRDKKWQLNGKHYVGQYWQ